MRLNERTRRWLPWVLLAMAMLVTAAVYWPGTTGGWVFDDFPNIVDNTAIHISPGHATLTAWINAALSSPASFLHRPLASITFAINWYFGGGDPWPFKVTNILIHLLNGLLLYGMLRELLRLRARMRGASSLDDTAATRLALVVTAGWLLLPINLMAVLYVVQRMESLSQVFVLVGLWAYLAGRRRMLDAKVRADEMRGFSLAAAGIGLGTLLGLTSKETAVLLPVFAFLAETVVLRFAARAREDSPTLAGAAETANGSGLAPRLGRIVQHTSRAGDRRIWALFAVTLFVPGVLGFAWLLRKALRPSAFSGRTFDLAERLLTEPRVLVDYLHWTLFPNPTVLSLYHDEIVKSTGLLSPWTTLAAIVFLALLIAAAVWLRKRRPLISLGIAWFFAAQLLTATIVPLELVYEQRMYFASIGVLLAIAAWLLGLHKTINLALPRVFLVTMALLWFGTATYMRAQEWSSQLMLAVKEANRHPESPRANYTAGRELMILSGYRQGDAMVLAKTFLHRAAAIPGSSTLPEQALIMFEDHRRQGDDADLWRAMILKLRKQPTKQEDISALISLTNCYGVGICRFDVSWIERAYQAALSRPHPIARLDAAYAAFRRDVMNDNVSAAKYLAAAATSAPREPQYRIDLAALYAEQGETERALREIDALRRMNAFGRFDGQIATLERLAERGKFVPPSTGGALPAIPPSTFSTR